MSDFTIEQLEALKEGTTPGPWEVNRSEIAVREIQDGEVDLRYLTNWEGEFDNDDDAELAAAAPELVDALIAEKRKNDDLCQEIGSLIGKLEARAENAESNRAYALAVAFRESERDLARILEADHG